MYSKGNSAYEEITEKTIAERIDINTPVQRCKLAFFWIR